MSLVTLGSIFVNRVLIRQLGICVILISILLGCTTTPEQKVECGMASFYMPIPKDKDLYRFVVTHLDGESTLSKPIFYLTSGQHIFTGMELIDSPLLDVPISARTPKKLIINVNLDHEYHIAAKFIPHYASDDAYWTPVVWKENKKICTMPKANQLIKK